MMMSFPPVMIRLKFDSDLVLSAVATIEFSVDAVIFMCAGMCLKQTGGNAAEME